MNFWKASSHVSKTSVSESCLLSVCSESRLRYTTKPMCFNSFLTVFCYNVDNNQGVGLKTLCNPQNDRLKKRLNTKHYKHLKKLK